MYNTLSSSSLRQSGAPSDHLQKLLSTLSHGDDVQAVAGLLCKGAPIEPWGGRSPLRLAVTTDRFRTVSLLLASGASLPASLLQEAWQSPDVTPQTLASLTTVSTLPACLSALPRCKGEDDEHRAARESQRWLLCSVHSASHI